MDMGGERAGPVGARLPECAPVKQARRRGTPPRLGRSSEAQGHWRPSAFARKTAIWARVTGDSGSYVVGVTPPVIPEAFSASMYWKAQ